MKFIIAAIGILLFFALFGWIQIRRPNQTENYQHRATIENQSPYNLDALKLIWRKRLADTAQKCNCVPIIDIESNFGVIGKSQLAMIKDKMDELGIALFGMSFENGFGDEGSLRSDWRAITRTLIAEESNYFFPVTAAGLLNRHETSFGKYVKSLLKAAEEDKFPMMGEFYFRHFISNDQHRDPGHRTETFFNIFEPIDGPYGELIFKFSQEHKVPFQIHLEVEDEQLDRLDRMMRRYPGAIVIWCHFARVRMKVRTKKYGVTLLEQLIRRHKNLYFDLSSSPIHDVYYRTQQEPSEMWDRKAQALLPKWKALISSYPWRFMSALDLAPSRMDRIEKRAKQQRFLFKNFPLQTQKILAYKAAWKLMFHETLKDNDAP